MPDVRHKFAVYFDSNGVRRTIQAKDLSNPNILADAKLKELYDGSEQFRIAPRVGQDITAHFYELTSNPDARRPFLGEDDETHNKRVEQLRDDLVNLSDFSLVLKETEKAGGAIKEIFKFPKYRWASEVHRILKSNAIVRHDIFGQSEELNMSIRRPWIAIEVIHTHYPEEETFTALKEASEHIPLIVLFDFTVKPNSFLRVSPSNNVIQIRPWTYYIRQGKIWKGMEETKINSSARLKIDVDSVLDWWSKQK